MNLLITGAWQGAGEKLNMLREMGHEVCFLQWEKDSLPCQPDWVEGIIGNGIFLSHPIENFKNLRYIQLTSAGFDRVPMDYVKEKGIEIHNARGVYSIPMAEFALSGILQLYKEAKTFARSQKAHEWKKIRTLREIYGSKALIVGCGSVGTEIAKRLKAFGAIVKGIDLFVRVDEAYDQMLPLESLDTLLPEADQIILTLPLTSDTRNLMNEDRLKSLKEGAILVNLARGGVLDYQAFLKLKQEGAPLKAVLDVFEEEPLSSDSPLWDLEDVILTPHNSFVGNGNQERLSSVIFQNLEKVSS